MAGDGDSGGHEAAFMRRIHEAVTIAGLGDVVSRRGFLLLTAGTLAGLTALAVEEALGLPSPLIILDNCEGLILVDPSRCVGCQRCELACVEFNDGLSQPSLSRVKVARALHFGPHGLMSGADVQGLWGNGVVVPGVCRQCPHPVPCATACPVGAIRVDETTRARVIDEASCVGCRICQQACPWDMIVFDEVRHKASKCFLCHGRPKCVAACPSGALRYVPWRDTSHDGGTLGANRVPISPDQARECVDCHVPLSK